MPNALPALARAALTDVARVLDAMPPDAAEPLIAAILGAKRIALHGLGREGLQMKGLAMRLYHLGLDAHVVGEMTTPPVGADDLLIVSTGPGDLGSIAALMTRVKADGAKLAVVTSQAQGGAAQRSDVVLLIPAQTMANDQGDGLKSLLPMGSLFEATMMLVFEALVLELRARREESAEAMRARHTNLE